MATNVKNAIAKALINGVVTDLFLKTGVENVVITENGSEKTLADKLTEIITALNGKATPADITNALGSYVKKEAGKGLSANDFTTELMTKLNGIAAGAQANKIESIKVNGTAQAIGADKSVNITVPTKTSDLTNDKKYQTDTEVATAVQTAISKTGHASYQKVSAVPTVDAAQENILYLVMNSTTKHHDIYAKIKGSSGSYTMEQLDDTTVDLTGYVQKEAGKGLSTNDYTTAEKQKLSNITAGAQVNKIESIKVNGTAQAIGADKSVNITVPTKTSDLTNDKKYQTDTEVATAVQTAISKTGHASYQKVSAVPTVDAAQENILYLVMNSTTKHHDIYAKIKGSSGSYTMEQLDDTTVDLTGYVQKEAGKGLSTNDYTTAEKQKLSNITAGAQVNKIESIKVNGTAQAIGADKSVNISVPIIYAQENQPAGLKAGDMWFQIIE